MSRKKELSFLIAVDKLPPSKKAKESKYDEIIKEFIESGLKLAKVKPLEGKKPKSMFTSLNKRVHDAKHSIRVRVRGTEIFLERK